MKKKSVAKMRLHRETLRRLIADPAEAGELQGVNGGVSQTCATISVCQPCTLTKKPLCP
jgi:hypothetical protein